MARWFAILNSSTIKGIDMKKLVLIFACAISFGCTDAGFEKLTNYGNSARVTCWSGDVIIYDGESTGKVSSEQNSDGYFFKDKSDGNLKEVSGNCVIVYK